MAVPVPAVVEEGVVVKLDMASTKKLYRDCLSYHFPDKTDISAQESSENTRTETSPELVYFVGGMDDPLDGRLLRPGEESPICRKCGLDKDCRNPYLEPYGSKEPLITVVYESISPYEDEEGQVGRRGVAGHIWGVLAAELQKLPELSMDDIRWLPIVRCFPGRGRNLSSSKLDWCGHHVVDDLNRFRPRLILTIGSPAFGFLNYKSNAQEWGGRVLTYRGWPDHWLTNPDYALSRPDPRDPSKTIVGHPLMGPVPTWTCPLIPVQHPKIIAAMRDSELNKRWLGQVHRAVKVAIEGAPERRYEWPWYEFTDNVERIKEVLTDLAENPTRVSYDSESTGLRPFGGDKIVTHMFRWTRDGAPHSLGFMWDFPESPLLNHIDELTPYVLKALYASKICGHNLTFDILFVYGNLKGASLEKLTSAMRSDTWHQAFIFRQEKGMLSLDAVASKWVPILAGYEENMELLITLLPELLDPEQGGHYARCPVDKVQSHFRPYVLGDVEVTDRATDVLDEKLYESKTYSIPLANPNRLGKFMTYTPPNRYAVYHQLISKASQVLTRMMGRGLFVDIKELEYQETVFPRKVLELRDKIGESHPEIKDWIDTTKYNNQETGWDLDLENKGHIKDILFKHLKIPITSITEAGKRQYPKFETEWATVPAADRLKFAAVDKFTLNQMAVNYPEVRPLIDYRGVFKQYSSYVRPIRGYTDDKIDKKKRTGFNHLCRDGCVHAQFLITGTRSGRLSSRNPNFQQLPADGIIKRFYTSRFGKERGIMYQADLSQIELRLIAMACGDQHMVKAYREGIDLHSLSMSRIFSRPYEQCTKEYVAWMQAQGKMKEAKDLEMERKISKTINFLTGYGGGAFGLQSTLASDAVYKSIEECEDFLTAFFDAYPSLKDFLGRYKAWILEKGCAVSVLGRIRFFEEVSSSDPSLQSKAQRAGCNHVIQATASDIMLSALIAIESLMREEGMESILVSTVHDSLLIDGVREELPKIHELVMEVLSNIPTVLAAIFPGQDLSWTSVVPYSGDGEFGLNYLDMHKLKESGNDWTELFARVDAAAA